VFDPNDVTFSAYNVSTQTGIASATATKLTGLTTEVYDHGGFYDAAHSKWTPPAGKVLITGAVTYQGGVVSGGGIALQLWKNGSYFRSMGFSASPGPVGSVGGTTVQDISNGTDYYELYAYADGTGTKTVSAGPISTYFQGTYSKISQ
jgi:hypothetical protein